MEVDYGPVHFHAVDMVRCERRNVYTTDGTDLIGVDWMLGFVGTYGSGGAPVMPSVTALSPNTDNMMSAKDSTADLLKADPRGRDPGAVPAGGINPPELEPEEGGATQSEFHTGPQTDVELAHWLRLPRQKLIVWAFDRQTGRRVRWLESPRPGFKLDVTGGPFPISNDVVTASGEPNSIGVHFQIKTRVSPCPIGSDRLVLAHRWKMTHAPDENGYLSRIIEGEVDFHMGVMEVTGVRPDMIMNQFIHPIPLGFERKHPIIEQSSRGNSVRYTVIDVDPTIIFSAGDSGATQIRILERHEITVPYAQSAKKPEVNSWQKFVLSGGKVFKGE